jgi:hypothetical protein
MLDVYGKLRLLPGDKPFATLRDKIASVIIGLLELYRVLRVRAARRSALEREPRRRDALAWLPRATPSS